MTRALVTVALTLVFGALAVAMAAAVLVIFWMAMGAV